MKKKSTYTIILIAFAVVLGIIVLAYRNKKEKTETANYTLLNRTGASAQTDEWKATVIHADQLMNTIQKNPGDAKSLNQLAELYIQEARVTGNYTYYDKAALKYVNDALKIDSLNFESVMLKSLLYISQHHFAQGLDVAKKASTINPYNSYIYGILTDGNVEMGDYTAAVESAQKMVDMRPDLRSYSRVSYLREIYGDYPGAVEAMEQAIESGVPGEESTEWSRIQMGHLYENTGEMKKAEMQYTIALNERPNYAYALAGLARIATASKDYSKAIDLYTQASSQINDNSIKEALADVYNLSGNKEKADKISEEVIDDMNKSAQSGNSDENIGHYVDRELAYAYIKIKDYDKALKHALLEYNRRPDNIDVNECVAWAYYRKGDYAKALPYIKTALKTNSKNPTLLCRAGLIYAKNGDTATAKLQLQQAMKDNPNIAEDLKVESLSVLKAI